MFNVFLMIFAPGKLLMLLFTGNVGDNKALAEVVKNWSRPVRLSSTKDLLIVRETRKL